MPSIKDDLIELYQVIAKRIAILYHQDKYLQVSSYTNGYLANSNYKLIVSGYEDIINKYLRNDSVKLDFDLSTLTFNESHNIDGVYDWDDEIERKTTEDKINNERAKQIVKSIENKKEKAYQLD